jgi:long-subunit fatty acid transport protein
MALANPARGQLGGMNADFAGGGARALAMGGAFIALADDATATEFNPAGLWQLRQPEIAAQVIYTREENRAPLRQSSIDRGEAVFLDETDSSLIPSFISFVYPAQRLVVGVSEFTNVYFDRDHVDPAGDVRFEEKGENYAYGLTLTTGITDDIMVGATLRYNTFRYRTDDEFTSIRDTFESDAPSANFGVIWRVLPRLRVGAVYKGTQDIEGDFAGLDVDTELPDTLGGGVVFLPDKRWRILVDMDRVNWSKFDPNPTDDFEKVDVWRYHAGAEWYAGRWKGTGIFLRGGYLYEESNAYYYCPQDRINPILRDLSAETDPVHHYTFGVGLARKSYQFDFGADVTEENGFDLIASTVWYF